MPTPYYVANPADDDEQRKRLQAAMLASGQPGGQQQPAPLGPALPATAPAPHASLAPASMADQPAAPRVDQLQHQVDTYQPGGKHPFAQALLDAAPAVGLALSGGWGGAQLMQAQQKLREDRETATEHQRQSLVDQLKTAQEAQTGQYEADQRRRQAVESAQTLAGSRLGVGELNLERGVDVAGIGAGARTAAATTAAGASNYRADQGLAGRKVAAGAQVQTGAGHDAANRAIGAGHDVARVEVGKYAADTSLGRQTRGFEHQDNKPTAAEDQRADYGHQLIQLSTDLDEIVGRRPDLVGPLAGRATTLRGLVGTNDPDIARLNALHHQLGIISMATHGMRNGQTLEAGANSIMNGLKNGPQALHAATDQARKSAQTFTEAPIRPGATAAAPAGTLGLPKATLRQQVGAPQTQGTPQPDASGFIYAKDPTGKIKRGKPGETLPKGWTYAAGPNG